MTEKESCTSFWAYERIKEKIIRNQIDPRQRLNEIDLAREFSISRTPIREALIMLQKDAFITRYEQSRGFYLKQYSLQDIQDLYEFREIIEVGSAARILENLTDQHAEELDSILTDVQDLIQEGRPPDALVRALDFHIQAVEVCNNHSCVSALRNCYEKLMVVSWTCQDLNNCINSANEHEEMLSALKARDLDAYVKSTRRHIEGARERIMGALRSGTKKLFFLP